MTPDAPPSGRELERLVEALQRHWLVRKYVNQMNALPLWSWPASQEPEATPVKAFRSPENS